MEAEEYQNIYIHETEHWWYTGMQQITTTLVQALYPQAGDLKILDAGCGTGAAMRYLTPFGQVTGFDFSALGLHFCQERGLTALSQADAVQIPFKDEYFDLLLSFDVLCCQEVRDYGMAFKEFARVLRPDGHLLIRLPAYNWLRGHHDSIVHIKHRFTTSELAALLDQAGFRVTKLSYANTLLFPIALMKRFADTHLLTNGAGSDINPTASGLNWILQKILSLEAGWLIHRPLPYGLTCIAIGQKI